MTESEEFGGANIDIINLAKAIRKDADIWTIFQRVRFREYLTEDEIQNIRESLNSTAESLNLTHLYWADRLLVVGILERLADEIWSPGDLAGPEVDIFISDRRGYLPDGTYNMHNPVRNNNPIELGWIMALAREVQTHLDWWNYFKNLPESEHYNPNRRDDPIRLRQQQFEIKHCLHNRAQLPIFALLYAKLRGKLEDITDVKAVKRFLTPVNKFGVNTDIYFENLNR